jgi:cyclophilin family peptidyl-prolyl cis-trans isomerase
MKFRIAFIAIVALLVVVPIILWFVKNNSTGDVNSSVVSPQNLAPTPTLTDNSISETSTPSGVPSEKQNMSQKTFTTPPAMEINSAHSYQVSMHTSKGQMKIDLFAKDTPQTVNNFVFLARQGYYDNTPFHRIIKGFMIQGGDPTGTGRGGPGYQFNDEPITRDYTRGTLAMANAGANTNGSQFFIMQANNPLPKNYVIFGMISASDSASLATLDAIASSPVSANDSGEQSKPVNQVTLTSVIISEK